MNDNVGTIGTAFGDIDTGRLRRPWWIVPAWLSVFTICSVYLVAGILMYAMTNRYAGLADAIVASGWIPFCIGGAISVLGLMNGARYTTSLRGTLGRQFGVRYLASDHWLTERVHELAAKLDLPPPRVGIIDAVNAYAAGPSPDEAEVIIGVPLVKAYTPAELDAVIGHELGHVVSGDMRQTQFAEGYQSTFGQMSTVIVKTIANMAAQYTRSRSTAYTAQSLGNSTDRLGRMMIGLTGELLVKGFSRRREFHADAVGAALSSPEAMISALEKLQNRKTEPTPTEEAYGYLMFAGLRRGSAFSTHPTFDQRREALTSGRYTSKVPRRR